MIHLIYIYIIINTFMLSMLHDTWNEDKNIKGNLVAFVLIFTLGIVFLLISTPIDVFNYFKKGSGKSILINLKFILFTKYYTKKLLQKIENKQEWIEDRKRVLSFKENMKTKTIVDKTHILAIKKAIAFIEENKLITK